MRPTVIVTHAANGDLEKVCEVAKKFPTEIDITHEGWNALQAATKAGHISIIRKLIELGADKNKQDQDGNTCLHLAVINRKPDVIKALCRLNCSEIQNNDGQSAKDLAQSKGFDECVDSFSITPMKKNETRKTYEVANEIDSIFQCDSCEEDIAVVHILPCLHKRLCIECSLKINKCSACGGLIEDRSIRIDNCSEDFVKKIKNKAMLEEKLQCKICFNETITGAFIPCGHTFCDCMKDQQTCPLCKTKVEKFLKLYF